MSTKSKVATTSGDVAGADVGELTAAKVQEVVDQLADLAQVGLADSDSGNSGGDNPTEPQEAVISTTPVVTLVVNVTFDRGVPVGKLAVKLQGENQGETLEIPFTRQTGSMDSLTIEAPVNGKQAERIKSYLAS